MVLIVNHWLLLLLIIIIIKMILLIALVIILIWLLLLLLIIVLLLLLVSETLWVEYLRKAFKILEKIRCVERRILLGLVLVIWVLVIIDINVIVSWVLLKIYIIGILRLLLLLKLLSRIHSVIYDIVKVRSRRYELLILVLVWVLTIWVISLHYNSGICYFLF